MPTLAAVDQAGAPTDRELLARLRAGDREALAPLMERHYRRLYRVALGYLRSPEDALDVVQETFVKAFRRAGDWDPASEPGAWLTRIAVNQAIDVYRKKRRRGRRETPYEAEGRPQPAAASTPGAGSVERGVLQREIGERLAAALRTLPDRQRAVVVLRHYEQATLEEIAQALDMSLGTVKSSLHRALERLRRKVGGLRP